eukprot:887841-Pelagomonas_calceolata.AAC.5
MKSPTLLHGNAAGCPAHLQNALEVALEGCEAIERVYRKGAKAVDDLKEIAKKLRALPTVETMLPTLALVGAPNVGKSSLVRKDCTGLVGWEISLSQAGKSKTLGIGHALK